MNNPEMNFETKEEGLENLKTAVKIRDMMSSDFNYVLWDEDCCEIANKLRSMDVPKEEIDKIYNPFSI